MVQFAVVGVLWHRIGGWRLANNPEEQGTPVHSRLMGHEEIGHLQLHAKARLSVISKFPRMHGKKGNIT